jgi:hypothetical protein
MSLIAPGTVWTLTTKGLALHMKVSIGRNTHDLGSSINSGLSVIDMEVANVTLYSSVQASSSFCTY